MAVTSYYKKLCFPILTLSIFQTTLAVASTVEEGCLAFSKIAERVAVLRDEQKSEIQVLSELMAKTGMTVTFAENLIFSIHNDLGQLTPDAIQYVYNDFCLKNGGDILAQALGN